MHVRGKRIISQGHRDLFYLAMLPNQLIRMSDVSRMLNREHGISPLPEMSNKKAASVRLHISTDEDAIVIHCALYDDDFAPLELDMLGSSAIRITIRRTPVAEKFFLKGFLPYRNLTHIPEDVEKINELDNTYVHYNQHFTSHFKRDAFVDIHTKRDIYLSLEEEDDDDVE